MYLSSGKEREKQPEGLPTGLTVQVERNEYDTW